MVISSLSLRLHGLIRLLVPSEIWCVSVEVLRYIGSRVQINHSLYRNVTTQEPYNKYEEVFSDVGEVNMFAVMLAAISL